MTGDEKINEYNTSWTGIGVAIFNIYQHKMEKNVKWSTNIIVVQQVNAKIMWELFVHVLKKYGDVVEPLSIILDSVALFFELWKLLNTYKKSNPMN